MISRFPDSSTRQCKRNFPLNFFFFFFSKCRDLEERKIPGKCEQIHRELETYSYLLKKSLRENLIFCAVVMATKLSYCSCLCGLKSWIYEELKNNISKEDKITVDIARRSG